MNGLQEQSQSRGYVQSVTAEDGGTKTARREKREKLTQAELKESLKYDPDTGIFTWIKKAANCTVLGGRAGSLLSDGYRRLKLKGVPYQEHRLVWMYMMGHFPKDYTDHVNGIKDDNRWVNLREATRSQNNQNRRISGASKSGVKGVTKCKWCGLWRAGIRIGGKRVYLGYFKTPGEASDAYQRAARSLHGEFYYDEFASL